MKESTLQKHIRLAIAKTGQARLLRNNVGYDAEHKVKYGLGLGSPDLIGCLRNGRVFALEIKTSRGRVSEHQQKWHTAARKWNCFVAVVRSVDEALAALARAERGEHE